MIGTAELYDTDGTAHLGTLTNVVVGTFQVNQNHDGSGSFRVRADDPLAAQITDRRIVKFQRGSTVAQALLVKTQSAQRVVDGATWLQWDTLPDLWDLLGDAEVMPERGYVASAPSSRTFGPSAPGLGTDWGNPAEWVTPQSVQWLSDTGIRKGQPAASSFRTTNPYWIALTDPYTTVSSSAVNHLRCAYSTTAAKSVHLETSADDRIEALYLDGGVAATQSISDTFSWRNAYTLDTVVHSGDHVIYARVANAPLVPGHTNPVAFALAMREINANGSMGSTLLTTNPTDWQVFNGTGSPGWRKAEVILKLFTEAQAAGRLGPSRLSLGFTRSTDSNGAAWADAPAEYVFDVGTSLKDVVLQLAESDIDVWIDPATMTLHAAARQGTSGSVVFDYPANGGSLTAYATTEAAVKYTRVVTRLQNDQWVTTTRASAETAVGGSIAAFMSLGSTPDGTTATKMSNEQLDQNAIVTRSVTVKHTTLAGPQPFVDYFLGDTCTFPHPSGSGTMRARVLAITEDWSTDVPTAYPEIMEDPS